MKNSISAASIFIRQFGIHSLEGIGVCLTVIRRHDHAGQDDLCAGFLAEFDHGREVFADHDDRRAAQTVIAAEFYQYDMQVRVFAMRGAGDAIHRPSCRR